MLLAETSSALLLNTTQCVDLFDFQVNSTLLASAEANLAMTEGLVGGYMSYVPIWVEESCARDH